MNGDAELTSSALDMNTADRSLGQTLAQELADPEVRQNLSRILLLAGIPLGDPIAGDSQAYAQRIDLLAHSLFLPAVADVDRDMTRALHDACTAALGTGGKTLLLRSFVNLDA